MDVEKSNPYVKRKKVEPKKPKEKRYKITNVSNSISTFRKPSPICKPLAPGESISMKLTSQQKKDVMSVLYRGKWIKRNDIVVV